MIKFEKFVLNNGLRVLVHEDPTSTITCMNILYDVGARDEDPSKTGFAHLFEHLMFGGSVNIPNYDEPLQRVGGENNAFTSNDITNYYLTLPTKNLETGFWLESDRMLNLAFSEKSLEVQRGVVIEEFKQRYLNQPYGDVWLELRPLAYNSHPYRWPTIGKEIKHIEDAKMEDVKAFFHQYYVPNNAILVVAGNVKMEEVERLSNKWFAPIPKGEENKRNLPVEPKQTEARKKTVHRDVPQDSIYKAYHMCSRYDSSYHAVDLLSDILSRGSSSRFYNRLLKEKKLFTEINAYVSGDLDDGLFVVSGKPNEGVSIDEAEKGITDELNKTLEPGNIRKDELTKVKNKMESTLEYSNMDIMNRALGIAIAELMGDPNDVNKEIEKYARVTSNEITDEARKIFTEDNCSTLYYLKNPNQ